MLPSTALYRQALPFPHRRETRIEVYHAGVRVVDNLPMVSGEVAASLTSRVTRQLSLEVTPDLWPLSDTDTLSPTRAVLKVSTGIGYPDGTREVFPVFTGRVHTIARASSGGVQLQAYDLAQDVIDFRFEQPQVSMAGSFITEQIRALIRQALPSAVFGTDTVQAATVPDLVWDEDRGQALDDLAQAVRGRWYALGDGSFVTRLYPYGDSVPVLALADGAGGTLTGAQITKTRGGVANSVTIVSERMDGSNPIRVTARDLSTVSPTQFGDLYGRVSTVTKIQTPLSLIDAQALASTQLASSIALGEQWTAQCIPDATLEPGDTISLTWRGLRTTQIIDSMSYPLHTGPDMKIAGRSVAQPLATT
jgi:hypothetical protein